MTSHVTSMSKPKASAREPVIAVPNEPSATGLTPATAQDAEAEATRGMLRPPPPSDESM